MLPCTWTLNIPMQPPLVCSNLLNYYLDLKSGTAYVDAVTAQVYCDQVVQVICQSNQFSSILNPVIIIPSMSGSFKGNGMNFDAYSTNIDLSDVINSIYPANMRTTYVNMQNISCFYQDTYNAVAVNGSSLRLSDSIPITSFYIDFLVASIGSSRDYSGVYYRSTINLVLLYPSNLAFDASGINCNYHMPVNGTPPIATNSPFKTTLTMAGGRWCWSDADNPAARATSVLEGLAVQAPAKAPATLPSPPSPSSTGNTNTIIGAVVGTLAGLLALIVLFFVVKHFAQQHLEVRYPPIRYTRFRTVTRSSSSERYGSRATSPDEDSSSFESSSDDDRGSKQPPLNRQTRPYF